MGNPTVEKGLAEIRRRRAQMWAAFLGYLPAMGIAAIVIRRFQLVQDEERTMLCVAILWMALFAITSHPGRMGSMPALWQAFPSARSLGVCYLEQPVYTALSQLPAGVAAGRLNRRWS